MESGRSLLPLLFSRFTGVRFCVHYGVRFTAPRCSKTAEISAGKMVSGLKAHEFITRLEAFCGSHDPEENETGLHTAHFWTPDNTFLRVRRQVGTTDTSGANHTLCSRFGERLSTPSRIFGPAHELETDAMPLSPEWAFMRLHACRGLAH